jgi:hypothetical protein
MSMDAVSPLRQRMIEDMNARKLCAGTQRGHLRMGVPLLPLWIVFSAGRQHVVEYTVTVRGSPTICQTSSCR